MVDVIPCEDAHAQERSLFHQVLAQVQPQQVWIADRNFCTAGFLDTIVQLREFVMWTRMKYVAIVDFELWEWSGFLEDFQAQKEPVFALCQNYERYLLGGLVYQVRFNLGVLQFPEQEEQVMAFLRVCENYNASSNWAKTLAG